MRKLRLKNVRKLAQVTDSEVTDSGFKSKCVCLQNPLLSFTYAQAVLDIKVVHSSFHTTLPSGKIKEATKRSL